MPKLLRGGNHLGINWRHDGAGAELEPYNLLDKISEEKQWDIFISYANEEKKSVIGPLYRAFRAVGAHVWYDAVDMPHLLPKGKDPKAIAPILESAIRLSQNLIFVVSPSYLRKQWTRRELNWALGLKNESPKAFVIWHGIDSNKKKLEYDQEVIKRIEATSLNSFKSDQSAQHIVDSIMKTIDIKLNMVIEEFHGDGRIMADSTDGVVTIISTANSLLLYIEFSGKKLDSLAWAFEHEWLDEPLNGKKLDIHFRGQLIYFQANRALCQESDVKKGLFINLGVIDEPVLPIFVAPGVTIGVMRPKAHNHLLLADKQRRLLVSDGNVKMEHTNS